MDSTAIIEKIKEIDRQSFIQKCKIMACWQKNFHIDFHEKMPDDFTFSDLMEKVENEKEDDVYPTLKKLVKHGVTSQQKQFLYDVYSSIVFEDNAENDFDCLLGNFSDSFRQKNLKHVLIMLKHNVSVFPSFYLYTSYPIPTIEYCFQTEQPLTEALLVQNGCLLIIRAVSSLDYELQVRKTKCALKGEVYEF